MGGCGGFKGSRLRQPEGEAWAGRGAGRPSLSGAAAPLWRGIGAGAVASGLGIAGGWMRIGASLYLVPRAEYCSRYN